MQNTLNNPIFSLFYIAKISRNRNKKTIENMFQKAYTYNKEETIKLLYYIGDINGLNERRVALICYKWLISNDENMFIKMFPNIVKYNRYDILLHFINTNVEYIVLNYIKETIIQDLDKINNNIDNITYLGKWLPNINSKNKQKKQLALKICRFMDWTPIVYRKNISLLKQRLNIVEIKMSNNQWNNIDYENVSRKSLKKYTNAFEKHDKERFDIFLQTKKENTPSVLLDKLLSSFDIEIDKNTRNIYLNLNDDINNIELLNNCNYIPVINTSLSMFHSQCLSEKNIPIKLCVLLSYYCMKNNDVLKNMYFDFNSNATLNKLDKLSLDDIVNNLESKIDNINIKALYENLLHKLIDIDYPTNQSIPNILIITDNPFNSCVNNSFLQEAIYNEMYVKYNTYGYEIPNIVFWNVNNRKYSQYLLSHKKGVILLNGYCDENLEILTTMKNTLTLDKILMKKLETYNKESNV